jgi:glycosyltransferase involved in cell wall biosynthesis
LELAAPLPDGGTLADALARLALKLASLGLVQVLADDVLIDGRGCAPGAPPAVAHADAEPPEANRTDASSVSATLMGDERGAPRRSLMWTLSRLRGLSVTIDGRPLFAASGGTQTYVLELVRALVRSGRVAVRVLVAPDLSSAAAAVLKAESVETVTYAEVIDRESPLTDVIHRPQQLFTLDDLALLRLVGQRIVVGHQDLIGYHNQSYHASLDAWRAYRRTTRLGLAGVDQVVFFSRHARGDALAEGLVAPGRAHVVGIGAESLATPDELEGPPDCMVQGEPYLFCLGADYAHKNRPFAIALLRELRALGWRGRLVLAGAHVPYGSSHAREQELLASTPELSPQVTDLGSIDDSTRDWLYAHAAAIVYPTVYEGYGLLPLEAARIGVPCLFAAQASLAELAEDAATLIAWDAQASARGVLAILSDGPAREGHVARLRQVHAPSWEEVIRDLLDVYERAVASAPSEAAFSLRQERERESYVARLEEDGDAQRLSAIAQEYQDAYHELEGRVIDGLPLIDEGGLLTRDQQRGLMRIAARRGVGRVALAPFGLIGRHLGDPRT